MSDSSVLNIKTDEDSVLEYRLNKWKIEDGQRNNLTIIIKNRQFNISNVKFTERAKKTLTHKAS
jgi:hypothetical protein